MTLRQRWTRFRSFIGFVQLFPWQEYRLVPGVWTPRFDPAGRIYMILAPADELSYMPAPIAITKGAENEERDR